MMPNAADEGGALALALELEEDMARLAPQGARLLCVSALVFPGHVGLPFGARRIQAAFQALISAFSRCGVIGNCVTAPGFSSASSMAEAIAAPTGVMPPSPAPLKP